jgi:hypothetical protein
MANRWSIAFLLFSVFLFLPGGRATANSGAVGLAVGTEAPRFVGTDLSGGTGDLAATVGTSKAVLRRCPTWRRSRTSTGNPGFP